MLFLGPEWFKITETEFFRFWTVMRYGELAMNMYKYFGLNTVYTPYPKFTCWGPIRRVGEVASLWDLQRSWEWSQKGELCALLRSDMRLMAWVFLKAAYCRTGRGWTQGRFAVDLGVPSLQAGKGMCVVEMAPAAVVWWRNKLGKLTLRYVSVDKQPEV